MNATVIFILSTCIGLIGGTFLVWKGVGIIRGLATPGSVTGASAAKGPIWTGIVLTGGNP